MPFAQIAVCRVQPVHHSMQWWTTVLLFEDDLASSVEAVVSKYAHRHICRLCFQALDTDANRFSSVKCSIIALEQSLAGLGSQSTCFI